ncbi:MAG: hypothetical protein OHK0013_38430 [Sandaracinaceae bacterium]
MRLLSLTLTTSLSSALLAASTGCMMMQSLQPETRLQDQVYQLNDEARWGRVDLAAGRTATAYRVPFVRSHRRWGRGISIGDVDITNIAMMQGGAQALVTYSWIDDGTMELHATTVRQSWVSEGDGFRLAGEDIVSGDDGLFLNVTGGPQRLPDAEGAEPFGEAAEGIASSEELEHDVTGRGEDRAQTPGERALASARPARFDSQGVRIE